MVSYPSLQQYFPSYNQAYQSNYNQAYQTNNNQFYQPNYNNYNTSVFQPNYNNYANTNIYQPNFSQNNYNTNIFNNNFNSSPYMSQNINIGGGSPMIMQGQSINMISSPPVIMQAAPQQQDNSTGFLQQLILMLLPMLLQPAEEVEEVVEQTDVHDTRVWGDPHYEIKGEDGNLIKFDHKGKVGDTYNVFKGDGYEVDGTYVDSGNALPIIGITSVRAGADTIQYDRSGKTSLNGKVLKDGSYDLNDGTELEIKGKAATITTKDGDSKIDLTTAGGAITVTPTGKFSDLGGIMGTAKKENRALTEDESNKFDITTKNKKTA